MLFVIPSNAPAIKAGKKKALLIGADNQETKNVNTIGTNVLPNTNYKPVKLKPLTVETFEPKARVY